MFILCWFEFGEIYYIQTDKMSFEKSVFWKKCLLANPSRREIWSYQAESSKGL